MPRTPRPTASSPAPSGSGTATFRPASTGDGSAANPAPILLLRADVARLPFATGSVAALHAGAAIHCWPNPQVKGGWGVACSSSPLTCVPPPPPLPPCCMQMHLL